MKIAITTANGKLGSAVIKQLVENIGKEHVIGIARSPEKATHLGIEIRKGDYDIETDFESALKGVDTLLMISGLADPDTRVEQHRKVIRAAKKNNVKKLVYTGILGHPEKTGFAPVAKSMRQTEEDVKKSGLDWIIGRNGMYIEADLAYVDTYKEIGVVANSANDGKSAYTSYLELARAYSTLLTDDSHNNKTYQLTGDAISQSLLVEKINTHFNTNITYQLTPVNTFYQEKKEAYGDFFGNIVAGIYEGISLGFYDIPSDFEQILGRPHKSVTELIEEFQSNQLTIIEK